MPSSISLEIVRFLFSNDLKSFTKVTCGRFKKFAIFGPVCAVSPSTANCPHTIKSKSGNAVRIALEIVKPVA
ncbi:unknown [Clostridium sp. CAG:813]|nr:unknown [Clostridium sp. CAG:813]